MLLMYVGREVPLAISVACLTAPDYPIISAFPNACNDTASQYGIVNIESASTLLPFMQKAARNTLTFVGAISAGEFVGNGADLRYVSLSRSDVCAASNCRQRYNLSDGLIYTCPPMLCSRFCKTLPDEGCKHPLKQVCVLGSFPT